MNIQVQNKSNKRSSKFGLLAPAITALAIIASFVAPQAAFADEIATVPCDGSSFTVTTRTDGLVIVDQGAGCSGGVTIPAGVTHISDFAFENGSSLTSVVFSGTSLTAIGNSAFKGTGLTSIDLPSSLTYIGPQAFMSTQLQDVSFGTGSHLDRIGDSAFRSLSGLSEITLPDSLVWLDESVFRDCSSLASVTISRESRLHAISSGAFIGTAITSLYLPSDLHDFDAFSFPRSVSLNIASDNPNFALRGGTLFSRDMTTLVWYPSSLTVSTYEIPNGVTTISNSAFEGAPLTSVTIPNSVTSIGSNAFRNITTVSIPTQAVRDHYNFLGWSTSYQGEPLANAAAAAAAVIEGQSLYSLWEADTYPVTFDSNQGSSVASTRFAADGQIDVPETPTRAGYSLAGWSTSVGGDPVWIPNDSVWYPFAPRTYGPLTLHAIWTLPITPGEAPDSRVVSIPAGVAAADLPATSALPRVGLRFAAASSTSSATVAPISNPASTAATPFRVTSSTQVVDIRVSGIAGSVTVCLDGASTDTIFHYTGGAWVQLPQQTFVNGQVCGVTSSFSPFAAAEATNASVVVESSQPAPVSTNSGPNITGRVGKFADTSGGTDFALTGSLLSQVSSVSIDGKAVEIVSKSDSEIVVSLPAHKPGLVDLVLKSDSGLLTFQDALEYRSPVVVRVPVTKTKTVAVGSAKSLSASQRKSVSSFAGSSIAGAVLTCSATYVSKVDAATAKALALAACATAKKANANLVTRLGSLVRVQPKVARKVILSLTN